ncbi:hypothetical protein FEM48_Zijuj08G0026000 [Ziziphus jujuba var. spinosa]|uniref:pectinesterase n=1 Tax=Ziziphus jujuba var. spinosa TaxID=714518 RepID=A0A978UWH6_ZIZJJ|nr:hypothetical protein FEM48_Zijuj08G0026000 [Ziziphus jujuba var. spinosa]
MLLAGAVALVVVVIQIPSVYCGKARLIPSDRTKLDEWIAVNMKDYVERKAKQGNSSLDIKLAKAEDSVKIVKVRKDGTGDFNTVTDAVKSIPKGNTQRVVVWIGGGEYVEKITVDVSKPFLTFYGDKDDMPTIVFNGTAFQYGTLNSATVEIESDYFVAANIAFVNSAPMPDGKRVGAQAVAMRISGDKAAFHNCRIVYIFDNDIYIHTHMQNTSIISVAKGMGVITAQAREDVSDDSGFTFVHCNITGTGDTYLGRAWKECPRVVFAYTFMGTLINSQGWSNNMHKDRNETTVYYGEYKCKGPGASTKGRVNYAKTLSDEEAQPFLSMTYLHGNKWILPPPKL